MKRTLSLSLLLTTALLLSGCTLVVPFIVKNESDKPVEVRYRGRNNELQLRSILPAKRAKENWELLPPDRYSFDRESRTIIFTLAPAEEVRVIDGDGFTAGEKYINEFPIEEIAFAADNAERTYRGVEARKQFAGQGNFLFFSDPSSYVLTYK